MTVVIREPSYVLLGPQCYLPEGQRDDVAIVVTEGKIEAIVSQDALGQQWTDRPHFSFSSDFHCIPGMIDMHIHGAAGADVMDATPEALATIAEALLLEGTTGFLATTMTEAPERIEAALQNVCHYQSRASVGAEILGVHLEGPFLSPKRMGAQNGQWIVDPDIALFDQWQQQSGQCIRLVTIAPEQPGAIALIQHLVAEGVIASVGHTDATYAQTQAAIEAGASHATHLFNAMRGIHHREPGAATALLLDSRVAAELIVDGVHLAPEIVKLSLNIKGKERVVLVTDAIRAKCCGEGRFELGGQMVTVANGEARLDNGVLAGSVLSMNQALQNVLEFGGLPLAAIVDVVSKNQAKALKINHKKGSIAVGLDADMTLLDERFQVVHTFQTTTLSVK